MTKRLVEFEYSPRPWQKEVLAGLAGKPRGLVVAHRRGGKTEVMAIRILMAAMTTGREHPAPLFGYVAPFLNQAKAVAWDRLKYYARSLLASGLAKVNESELTVSLWNRASIRLFGADYPDRLRGLGFDGVVMDEVAQMKPDTWNAVVLPALSDRGGWAAFIGTPKGRNVFYDLYSEGTKSPNWYVGEYPATKTGVFDDEQLEILRAEMGGNLFRQEYLCDFTADNPDSFIDFQDVQEAAARPAPKVNQAPLIFGIDVAAQGGDRSCLVARRGAVLESIEVWREPDTMRTVGRVGEAITRLKPRAVFMDNVGLGLGPVHRLKQLGYRVIGINAGRTAGRDDQFANLKAEMWWKMNEWLKEACIPDDPALRKDLLTPKREYDGQNRIKVESKDALRKRVQFSTDLADALALTFAQPVAAIDLRKRRQQFAEMD